MLVSSLSAGGCFLKCSDAAFIPKVFQEFNDYLCKFAPPIYVIAVRCPQKALLSWHNMHKKIAQLGNPAGHWAARERNFVLNASIEEYEQRLEFAFGSPFSSLFDYSKNILMVSDVARNSQVYILDFRKVHLGVEAVMGRLLSDVFPSVFYPNNFPHRNAGVYAGEVCLPPVLRAKLANMESKLDGLIATLPRHNLFLGS